MPMVKVIHSVGLATATFVDWNLSLLRELALVCFKACKMCPMCFLLIVSHGHHLLSSGRTASGHEKGEAESMYEGEGCRHRLGLALRFELCGRAP